MPPSDLANIFCVNSGKHLLHLCVYNSDIGKTERDSATAKFLRKPATSAVIQRNSGKGVEEPVNFRVKTLIAKCKYNAILYMNSIKLFVRLNGTASILCACLHYFVVNSKRSIICCACYGGRDGGAKSSLGQQNLANDKVSV